MRAKSRLAFVSRSLPGLAFHRLPRVVHGSTVETPPARFTGSADIRASVQWTDDGGWKRLGVAGELVVIEK